MEEKKGEKNISWAHAPSAPITQEGSTVFFSLCGRIDRFFSCVAAMPRFDPVTWRATMLTPVRTYTPGLGLVESLGLLERDS